MSNRGDNVLDGMEELLLSLARKHSSPHQWGSWLKIILQAAAMEGDEEAVLALLKAGAYSSGRLEKDDRTPLHAAAQAGSLAVVSSMLKTKASDDVNKKTQATGETPLHLAVKHGHTGVALALVRAGGDVNLNDASGTSPLIRAVSDGRAELVKNLLLRGSRVESRDKDGYTLLGVAAQLGHFGVIKVLLQAGASAGARGGEDYMSPVDYAVMRGDTTILSELLSSGPSLDSDGVGYSALSLAVEREQTKAIDMLIDAGAAPNFGAKSVFMHKACFYLKPGSVEALLRGDAKENTRNQDNELPHDIVGHGIREEERDNGVVEDIRKMLARAPADRAWRRRGWLAMLNARKRGTVEEHRRKEDEDEAEKSGHDEAETPSVLSSRRKLADGGKWVSDDTVDVHPSRKRFQWMVTKMIDDADELIFRKVVSYL
ncbi:unnamed protein product [Laminaria digitata]